MTTHRAQQSSHGAGGSWGRGRKCAISLLIAFHLLAVFTAPFMFAASGLDASSPFAAMLMRTLRPYIDFAYLNHGYFFFAPNPGPSHLFQCRLEFDDGREAVERRFPDRNLDFPRLLYHRHFMLAEQLHAMYTPELSSEEFPNPQAWEDWQRQRETYRMRRAAFEAHLRSEFGAQRVTLVRVEHRSFSPEEKLRGLLLNDPSLYQDLPETGPPNRITEEDGGP